MATCESVGYSKTWQILVLQLRRMRCYCLETTIHRLHAELCETLSIDLQ